MNILGLRNASREVSGILTDPAVIGLARDLKLYVDEMEGYFGPQSDWRVLGERALREESQDLAIAALAAEAQYTKLAVEPTRRMDLTIVEACALYIPNPGDYTD